MRFVVFHEFSNKDLLGKLPDGVVAEVPEDEWRFSEDKRSDDEKEILAKTAKLIFSPKVDQARVPEVVKAIVALGFDVVKSSAYSMEDKKMSRVTVSEPAIHHPITSTGHVMDDRVVFHLRC